MSLYNFLAFVKNYQVWLNFNGFNPTVYFLLILSVSDNETVASQAFCGALNNREKNQSYPFETFVDAPEIHHCIYCPETFIQRHWLKRHLSECHGSMLPFHCHICGKGCFSRQSLSFHMKGHDGKRYACAVCGHRFTLKHHLTRHTSTVHGLRQCSSCLAVFDNSHLLKQHIEHCQSH